MELPPSVGLVAVFVLVLANGFFVATEFAVVAVRRSRLDQLVQEGRVGAAAARDVVGHLDAYIAATQFGITLASLALGWIGEPVLAHLLEPLLTPIVGPFAPAAAHGTAVGVAFAVITGLHIVLGELAPKGLALQHPEQTSLWVARPIQVFYAIFKWPITALNGIGNGVLRLLGQKATSGHEMVHSVEELRLLVTGMHQAGVVDDAEARIAQRAFSFGDVAAGALMTPRTDVEAVPVTIGLEDLLRFAESTHHNQLPVYEDSLDNIVGVLHVRGLFKYRNSAPEAFDLRALMHPPLFEPETRTAADLLEDMRSHRCHLAVVVDEYGGTAGIITLKDLLEALVGRIEEGSSPADHVTALARAEPDGSILIDGSIRIDEFEEIAKLRLDDESQEGVDTLAGLVVAAAGRFPEIGEEVRLAGRKLRVEKRDGLRVAMVRLLPPPESSGRHRKPA